MDDEPDEPRPPKREQLSKTPSWIMLGFALGAGCVLLWPHREESRAVLTSGVTPRRPAAEAPPPTIERATFFESVFAEWSKYAVWDSELTEVAFWSADTKTFSEKFEVYRSGDRFYFRSIPEFTRPVLTHGVPNNSPLQFTEPQAGRDEWLKENSTENLRKFLGAPEPKKP